MTVRMNLFLFLMPLLIVVTALSADKSPGDASVLSGRPGWLAYGDLRGSFEPCGCDPKTDLGGVQRLAAFATRERANDPAIVLLDTGNNISPPGAEGDKETLEIKDSYLIEGLVRLNPAAMLPGRFELLRSDWMEKTIVRLQSGSRLGGPLPLVLSNLNKNNSPAWLRANTLPFRKVGGLVIYGYTWDPKISKMVLSAKSSEFRKRMKILAQNEEISSLQRILLFSGPADHLKTLIDTRLFDEIISGNDAPDLAKPETPDRENESRTIVRFKHSGKLIYQTPTGGQGVLRGGRARENLARSLQEIINPGVLPDLSTPKSVIRQPGSQLFAAKNVTWLDRSYLDPDIWPGFFASYESAVRTSFEAKSRKRLEGLKNTAFAGSDACKGCHAGAYDSWIKSKHANAFAILIQKNKAHDAECVSCHVLGASEPGGFVSQEDSPQFMNVHCENCHGPRKAHATNPLEKPAPTIDKKNPGKVCVSCHHPPHSPDFDYKKYWSKIRHGHGAGADQ